MFVSYLLNLVIYFACLCAYVAWIKVPNLSNLFQFQGV